MEFEIKMKTLSIWLLSAISYLIPVSINAALLITDEFGALLGAELVEIDGEFYDLEFKDGSCTEIFSGCDSVDDFEFDVATAPLATQALLDQVLIGIYDDQVELTFGCESTVFCTALLPVYAPPGFAQTTYYADNGSLDDFGSFNVTSVFWIDRDSDFSGLASSSDSRVFAVFNPSQVPLPSAGVLFFLAISTLFFNRNH